MPPPNDNQPSSNDYQSIINDYADKKNNTSSNTTDLEPKNHSTSQSPDSLKTLPPTNPPTSSPLPPTPKPPSITTTNPPTSSPLPSSPLPTTSTPLKSKESIKIATGLPAIKNTPLSVHSTIEAPKPDVFKYIFFISLAIFITVMGTIAYTVFMAKDPKTLPATILDLEASDSLTPTSTSSPGCRLNDKEYQVDQSFLAADGCNTCTCNSNLIISCTNQNCQEGDKTSH